MKKIVTVLFAVALLSTLSLANGLNLNSLGSRALAMGGAFVGLADDFSAVYWNPAGLASFKTKTFGFYGTDIIPSGTYKLILPSFVPAPYPTGQVVDATTKTKHYLGGMAVYIHPITENVVGAIGVYTPSGLGADWPSEKLSFLSYPYQSTTIEWKSKIGLITIAPTLAVKVNDMLSLGAAINVNYGMFDTSMWAGKTLLPPSYTTEFDLGQYEESETGWGLGATVGLLFRPHQMFSLGATFRTASAIKFSGNANISNLVLIGQPGSSEMERTVTWPEWLAVGAAFFPLDNLTFTADIQYTHWKRIETIKTEYTNSIWSLLMSTSGKDTMPMYWEDATQLRFGVEYKASESLAFRAGYYIDPSPAPDKTMNILLPNYDFNVLTFGLGYNLNGLQIDLGFEYLMGKERSIDFAKTFNNALNPYYNKEYEDAMPGTYNMKIIAPNISISYRF
jgi:long-chain fatty acid transport protein